MDQVVVKQVRVICQTLKIRVVKAVTQKVKNQKWKTMGLTQIQSQDLVYKKGIVYQSQGHEFKQQSLLVMLLVKINLIS